MAKNRFTQTARLAQIRQELLKAEEVSITKLASKFNVSRMTACRDLDMLESMGEIVRTHGGGASAKKLTFEFAFRDRQNKNDKQKDLIAQRAIEHVKDGDVIVLDTGTTTLQIARKLIGKRKITIITTSLAIISEIQFDKDIEAVLLGGFLRAGLPDVHGPLTERDMDFFRPDIAFMGADAIDENGSTYTVDLRIVNLDRKMAGNSKKTIVVADSSKFGKTAMCKVFDGKDYNLIITDSELDKKVVKYFAKQNIEIETA